MFYSKNLWIVLCWIIVFIPDTLGQSESEDFLIVGTTPRDKDAMSGIVKYYPDTGRIERIPVDLYSFVTAIAYDFASGRLFWGNFAVVSADRDGKRTIIVPYEPFAIVTGLAFDPSREMLYYSSLLKGSIVAIDLRKEGNNTTDFMNDIESPMHITLDYENEYVYWASYEKLERAKMDGTRREKMYGSGERSSAFFTAVYLDEANHMLYACQLTATNGLHDSVIVEVDVQDKAFKLTEIPMECLTLSGNSTHVFIATDGPEGLFAKRKNEVANSFAEWTLVIDNSTLPEPNGLFYATNTTVRTEAKCNATCDSNEVCLYTSSQSRCNCLTDHTGDQCLERDLRRTYPSLITSEEKQVFGVLGMPHQLMTFQAWNFFRFINEFQHPGALAVDAKNKLLYANFPELKKTFLANLNNMKDSPSHDWTALPYLNYSCNGMAYDWLAGTLMCTVNGTHRGIVAASVKTGFETWLLPNGTSEEPFAIAMDPQYGYVYWTNLRDNTVMKTTGQGKASTTLQRFTSPPTAINLDYVDEKYYVGVGSAIRGFTYANDQLVWQYPNFTMTFGGLDVLPPFIVVSGYGRGTKGVHIINYATNTRYAMHYTSVRDLAILHERRQPTWPKQDDCHGGCAICLSTPQAVECVCPDNQASCRPTTTPSSGSSPGKPNVGHSRSTTDESPPDVGLIAGLSVGGFAIVLLIILVFVLLCKRKSPTLRSTKFQRQKSLNNHYDYAENISIDGISIYDQPDDADIISMTSNASFASGGSGYIRTKDINDEAPELPPRPNTSDYGSGSSTSSGLRFFRNSKTNDDDDNGSYSYAVTAMIPEIDEEEENRLNSDLESAFSQDESIDQWEEKEESGVCVDPVSQIPTSVAFVDAVDVQDSENKAHGILEDVVTEL